MEYNILIKNWGRMFTVPCTVVDEYIKLASGNAVKVLLCLLCSNSNKFKSEDIASMTGINTSEVDDAIEFWCQLEVIENINKPTRVKDTEKEVIVQKPEKNSIIEAENPAKNTLSTKTSVKYSPKEIEKIVQNSADLKFMMDNIQTVLKKPITYTEQCSLVNLHEYYGFSVSIILMLFDYCQSIGKTRIAYVEAIAKDWFQRDIITHEAVEKEIIRLIDYNSFENKVKFAFGLETRPSPKQKKFIDDWMKLGLSIDMITFAYEKCVDNTNKLSFEYINKILVSWSENKYTKREDVISKEQKPVQRTEMKSEKKNEHSYDLDEIFKKSFRTATKN